MTTLRTDPVLGQVFPVVLVFGDEPPTELGVIKAGQGPEQTIADLAGILHDAADVMMVGGDEAIRLARARYQDLMRPLGGGADPEGTLPVVADYSACGPECPCSRTAAVSAGPPRNTWEENEQARAASAARLAEYDAGVRDRLAVEITGHAVAEAREPLTTLEALALQEASATGGARLAEVEQDEQTTVVTRGQLRGHCAHDVRLDRPCQMCGR